MSWGEYLVLIVGLAALFVALFRMASAGHGWSAAIIFGLVMWAIILGLTL